MGKSNYGPGSLASTEAATVAIDEGSQESYVSPRSISGSGSRHVDSPYCLRRPSDVDDTEKPLPRERERISHLRIADRLECANLRFSNVGVVGREREISALRIALGRARGQANCDPSCKELGNKELVLISGASGSGKSRLASILADACERSGGLFVEGKYNLYLRDEPYLGISQACGEIVGRILRLKESGDENEANLFHKICKDLKEQIGGDEIHLLANVIPPLMELAGDDTVRHHEGSVSGESREQFKFAFRKFIRVVSKVSNFGKPLCLMLDDIMWADAASFELVEFLLADRESSGIVIVGCYRPEEISGTHILTQTIREMKEKSQSYMISVTEIELGPLPVSDVTKILVKLLSLDDAEKVMPLAELCHRRCFGNPFHLIQFLRMLEEERLLQFNVGSFRWAFDVEKIEKKSSATSNVVEMVSSRLEQLPAPLQEVLRISACLGSSFESQLLHVVWSEMEQPEEPKNILDTYLGMAVNGNILEYEGDKMRYRWTHDKVQEAAIMLKLPNSNCEYSDCALQFKVGLVLLGKYNDAQVDDSVVFILANLVQSGMERYCILSRVDDKTREDIAKVSLDAAKKAAACSAFKSAAKYAKNGIALLPSDAFRQNYHLALELHSLGAEVEGFIGNDSIMNAYCEEVIRNAHHILDKIRCYHIQLLRLSNTMKDKRAACNLCLEVLDELGCFHIPRNSLAQKVKSALVLRKVKKVEPEPLNDLPVMTDPTILATMSILKRLAMSNGGDMFLMTLASHGLYQITLEHGLCSLTTSAAASLAIIKVGVGDMEGAKLFTDQALALLPRSDSKSEISRTYYIAYFVVKPWSVPFFSCLKFLEESYRVGLQCGDTESGCWGIASYLLMSFLSETRLDSLVSDIGTYLPQVKDLGREEQALHITTIYQACLCLMGLSDDPTEMSGKAIPDREEFEFLIRSEESKMPLLVYQFVQGFLYTVFGDHAKAAKLALARGYDMLCSPPGMTDTLMRGISFFEMARQTRNAKYKRAAKKTLSAMRKWGKLNNPNIVHKRAILESEQFALNGKKEKATQSYETSISLSARCGMLLDAALASERYAEYLMNYLGQEEKANQFLKRALKFYKEWGAEAKVIHMIKKYPSLFEDVPSV